MFSTFLLIFSLVLMAQGQLPWDKLTSKKPGDPTTAKPQLGLDLEKSYLKQDEPEIIVNPFKPSEDTFIINTHFSARNSWIKKLEESGYLSPWAGEIASFYKPVQDFGNAEVNLEDPWIRQQAKLAHPSRWADPEPEEFAQIPLISIDSYDPLEDTVFEDSQFSARNSWGDQIASPYKTLGFGKAESNPEDLRIQKLEESADVPLWADPKVQRPRPPYVSPYELEEDAIKPDSYLEDSWIPKGYKASSWADPEFQDLEV